MQNKINFAPINTGFAKDGIFTNQVFDFYKKRSGNNINSVCIGNVSPSLQYATNIHTATFEKKNHSQLAKLLYVIQDQGSIPCIQVGFRYSPVPPKKSWDTSTEVTEVYSNYISNLKEYEIKEYFSLITKSVKIACMLGYKSIQIHAAHGYLISLLLCQKINRRFDCFSYKNLAGIDILFDMLSQYIDKIDIRINVLDGVSNTEFEIYEKQNIINYLYNHKMISKISLSNGIYDINKTLIYPSVNESKIYLTNAYRLTKGLCQEKFELAGRCELLARDYESDLQNTNFQLAIGRGLIANPRLATNILTEPTCNQCGHCHYFSNENNHITCPLSNL